MTLDLAAQFPDVIAVNEAASRGRRMGRPRQAQLLPVWDDDGVPQPRLQRPNSRLRRRTAVLS